MDHRRFHWLEKLQVELAVAAALLTAYFVVWPIVQPNDPLEAVTFFAGHDDIGRLVALVIVLCAFAVGCTVITLGSRPEGAITASLLGLGGISLRSPQFRTLFWAMGGPEKRLFAELAAELVVLSAALVLAIIIIRLLRRAIAVVVPDLIRRTYQYSSQPLVKNRTILVELLSTLGCFVVGAIVGGVLFGLLLRSPQRGQILFALIASFAVGLLAAHQIFSTRFSLAAWLAPMLVGVFCYALGAGSEDWMEVPLCARVLPIDWLTAGAGGGLLGYWISRRINELKYVHEHHK